MSENEFINGLIVKAPNDNAPEYVKAKVSIKRVMRDEAAIAELRDAITKADAEVEAAVIELNNMKESA